MPSLIRRHHVDLWSWPKKLQKSPISIKPEILTQFSIPGDCHLLSHCCSPTYYLSPSTKYVNSPSPPLLLCLINLWHPMMKRECRPGKTLWGEHSQLRLHVLLLCQLHTCCGRLHLLHGTLGVNCRLKVEIPSHCSMTPPPPANAAPWLRPQRPVDVFPVNKGQNVFSKSWIPPP